MLRELITFQRCTAGLLHIDDSYGAFWFLQVGLHGGIYRSCCKGCIYHGHPDCLHGYVAPPVPSDFYLPSPENREIKGFLYDSEISPCHRKCSCTLSVALFVYLDLTAAMLVFCMHAGMQVACCSQRSSLGCSSTIAVRPTLKRRMQGHRLSLPVHSTSWPAASFVHLSHAAI